MAIKNSNLLGYFVLVIVISVSSVVIDRLIIRNFIINEEYGLIQYSLSNIPEAIFCLTASILIFLVAAIRPLGLIFMVIDEQQHAERAKFYFISIAFFLVGLAYLALAFFW